MAKDIELLEDEFEDDEISIVTLTDENGAEVQYEYLDMVEYNNSEYIILLPLDEADEDGGVVEILEIINYDEATDTEDYASVDDEAILNAVYDIFKERFKDVFNFV